MRECKWRSIFGKQESSEAVRQLDCVLGYYQFEDFLPEGGQGRKKNDLKKKLNYRSMSFMIILHVTQFIFYPENERSKNLSSSIYLIPILLAPYFCYP